MDHLRAIYIFARTVELGSFRATARDLGISPSVVSYQISRLEKHYDVALLYRSTRKLSLTDTGEKLFESAQEMMRAADAGLDGLAGGESAHTGRLRVSVPAAFAGGTMCDILAEFAAAYPRVELVMTYSDQQQDLIAEGIDVAIRAGDMPDSSLKSRYLTSVARLLVASPGYLKSKPVPQAPRDLAEWEWLRFSMLPPVRKFKNELRQTAKVRMHCRISVDSVEALCNLSVSGLGLATAPDFVVQKHLEQGALVEVLPGWKLDPLPLHLVWPGNSPRGGLTPSFTQWMVGRFSATGE